MSNDRLQILDAQLHEIEMSAFFDERDRTRALRNWRRRWSREIEKVAPEEVVANWIQHGGRGK